MALDTLQEYCQTGTPVDAYVVDAHCHMGPYFNFQVVDEGSAEAMVRSMDTLGIDVSLFSPHLAITADWREGNLQSAEAAAAFPGRLVPMITVSGRATPDEVQAEVTRGTTRPAFRPSSSTRPCTASTLSPTAICPSMTTVTATVSRSSRTAGMARAALRASSRL